MTFKFRNVVLTLIVVNIVAFILTIFLGDHFLNLFILKRGDLFNRPWTLITSMFLHADPMHLLFNMYGLFIFGSLIEQKIGSKRVLATYFSSGLAASIIGSFIYHNALGASGAIMAIIGVTIVLLPELKVLFLFFVPMSLRTAGIIFALIDIFGIIMPNSIANVGHLVGLGAGLLWGSYLKGKRKTFRKRFSKKTHLDNGDIDEYLRSGRI